MKSAALCLLVSIAAFAQTATDSLPRFDVVSIKRNTSNAPGAMGCNYAAGRCVFTYTTADSMLMAAFGQERYKIAQMPGWFASERFDVEAKAEGPITREQAALMFQAIFVDRFNLQFHRETREVSGLVLELANDSPTLVRTPDQTALTDKEQNSTIRILDLESRKPISASGASPARLALLETSKSTMSWLANFISRMGIIGPVADRTGLEGYYAFHMRWQPEGDLSANANIERIGPAFITALREQLGLRLRSAKIPIEFVVIDRLERPTAN